jgi:hypothetical protein
MERFLSPCALEELNEHSGTGLVMEQHELKVTDLLGQVLNWEIVP